MHITASSTAGLRCVPSASWCKWRCIRHYTHQRGVCTSRNKLNKKSDDITSYSDTIQLPTTSLPLRITPAKRRDLELSLQKSYGFESLYTWQRKQDRKEEFVLHDGPPYANGNPHIGHAVNKILKDITLRHKLLQGYKIHYIPGWDCHGLPIELKATQAHKGASETASHTHHDLRIRNIAQKFAHKTARAQQRVFSRWGLLGDWSNAYHTYDPLYIKRQLNLFMDLYEKGYIYRDYKPVYFSPYLGTSLAEAELEYQQQHVSPSVYLALPVTSALPSTMDRLQRGTSKMQLYVPIWTTTPWTLPMNQAVCYAPGKPYVLAVVQWAQQRIALVWSEELLQELQRIAGMENVCVEGRFEEEELASLKYRPPLKPCECPCLPATHVSMAKGTGFVHTSPAHGHDDFLVALKHKLTMECYVEESGKYTSGVLPELVGLNVLEEGNEAVLKLLSSNDGAGGPSLLLETSKHTHSYPYDWRSKKPVIIRATKQWFFDTQRTKEAALAALESVEILPERLEEGMIRQLKSRPYWCISRQRVWGAPIPVFYDQETNQPIVERHIIEHVLNVLQEEGCDAWWRKQACDLLPPMFVKELHQMGRPLPKKGSDILDIWFDSGSSWYSVLGGPKADLYLEGVDQFNGWFLSSLLTSVAATGKPPYRMIYVHGFALDEHGRKMSKSLGNVVDPQVVTDGGHNHSKNPPYGADVLRWWVGHHASDHSTMSIGHKHLEQARESVQKIRSVLRFLVGSIRDYQPTQHSLPVQDLRLIDQYLLHLLHDHVTKIWGHYDNFRYNWVTKSSLAFISSTVSGLYIASIRDRLYCDARMGSKRMSALLVLHHLLHQLLITLAPVLPHLAEEVMQHTPNTNSNRDLSVFHRVREDLPSSWHHPELAGTFEECLRVRDKLFHSSPASDWSKLQVHIKASHTFMHNLELLQSSESSSQSGLCELLQTSRVTIEAVQDMNEEFSLTISNAEGGKCVRCRRYTTEDGEELCVRCQDVINSMQ